jgi:hypothetical protein
VPNKFTPNNPRLATSKKELGIGNTPSSNSDLIFLSQKLSKMPRHPGRASLPLNSTQVELFFFNCDLLVDGALLDGRRRQASQFRTCQSKIGPCKS